MSIQNVVRLIGVVGNDFEPQHVGQSGSVKLDVNLAVRKYNKNDPEDNTDWFKVVAWNKVVERLQKLEVGKGTKLAIEGTLMRDQWEADGQKREKVYVMMHDFELMSKTNGGGGKAAQAPLDDFDNSNLPSF